MHNNSTRRWLLKWTAEHLAIILCTGFLGLMYISIPQSVSCRTLHMQFELEHSCLKWYELVQRAVCSTTDGPQQAGSVPCSINRCISHITQYGEWLPGAIQVMSFKMKNANVNEGARTAWNACSFSLANLTI